MILAALQKEISRPILFVTARSEPARQLTGQVRTWSASPDMVLRFADPDALPYERIAWGQQTVQERVMALAALSGCSAAAADCPLVVTSTRALMQKTLPPEEFRSRIVSLRVGQVVSLNGLLESWLAMGYTPASLVREPGSFSRRGGIVDIFPASRPYPVRIELFGDEVESLRIFDPTSQRSEGRIEKFIVSPAGEALPVFGPAAFEAVRSWELSGCHLAAQSEYREQMAKLQEGIHFRGIEFYMPYLYPRPGMFLDYWPEDSLLTIEDPQELAAVAEELEGQAAHLQEELLEHQEIPPGLESPMFSWKELSERLLARPHLIMGHNRWPGQEAPKEVDLPPALGRVFGASPHYGGQLKKLLTDLVESRGEGEGHVVLVSRQSARLANLLAQEGIQVEPQEGIEKTPPPGSLTVVHGTLTDGWALRPEGDFREEVGGNLPPAALLLFSDAEVFGWAKPQPRRRERARGVAPETFFADLKPGDYVVHVEHGIGVFRGLIKLNVEGTEREYLEVDYAVGDKLYVPIHHADRLSRYVGADDQGPQLHRLGTADWEATKNRARQAVADIARELLELYSAREIVPGYAFAPDSAWQAELEASFPYVETEDQVEAIETVKRDMEKPQPMDRLVCGDVGYGKTEVALRAAFKAVMDGRQVALLVPTTVLAQQHYETFRQRLEPFPVEVEMLSRFRSPKEQKEVLEKLRSGRADIVIGTHRLIQKDVAFKDLGLLIIDEEQRFGVAHKERLKQMRKEVDVLTLTATPIPRTLHMSLSGVRDMSTIDTPPEERLPIHTQVAEYDEKLIRTAILREVDRGGQVYFVHNRVMGIRQVAQRVAKIVPEVSATVAHGQMPERELEKAMLDFAAGEYDLLVCTAIIESGLDIPNVNTIIINRADQFGLAQLYQLRGRVGRGAVRAYAYLLYDKYKNLTEIARKRLEAILEANELGAGFRIAMQDLEIRGAGEILGARQHGHIADVGFDLYCRLLAQAVRELRGGDPAEASTEERAYLAPLENGVQINLPLAVYLPGNYLPDENLRLRLYRRLAGLTTLEQVDEIGQELTDRFGPLPEPALNLLYQLRLKVLALQAGAQAVITESGQLCIKAESLEKLDREGLQRRLGSHIRVTRRQIWLPLHPNEEVWRLELERVLKTMVRLLQDPARA